MAGTNQFKLFAAGGGANTLTQTAYAALTTLLSQGFQPGVASSEQINTLFRQLSTVMVGTAQFAVDQSGGDANDDGLPANFAALLLAAVQATIDARLAAGALPAGTIMPFAMPTPPAGWLEANGASLVRVAYPALFSAIGATYGAADINHFTLPDYRGVVLRGWDHGRGLDPGRVFGSYQADALQNITGQFPGDDSYSGAVSGAFLDNGALGGGLQQAGVGNAITFDASRVARTAAETRPKNIAVLICIKA